MHINWNIPNKCIDINYILLFYKLSEDTDYDFLKLKYINNTFKTVYNQGKLTVFKNVNRLNYNFYFNQKKRFNCFIYLEFTNNKKIMSNIF